MDKRSNRSIFSWAIFLILCLLLIVATFINWPNIFCRGQNGTISKDIKVDSRLDHLNPKLKGKSVKGKINFIGFNPNETRLTKITKEYETVTREIQLRLEHEHLLFIFQFILIGCISGAVVGFFDFFIRDNNFLERLKKIYNDGHLPWILGIISLAILILDIHIRYNSMIIEELGGWVRLYYEDMEPALTHGWEQFLKDPSSAGAVYHPRLLFPIAKGMLYLPTIILLMGYYISLYHCIESRLKKSVLINQTAFWIVHFTVLLFGAINHWKPSCEFWIYSLLFLFIPWIIITIWIIRCFRENKYHVS